MHSWLHSFGHKGLAGEDLSPKLGSAVAFPGNWFKFAFTAPNRLDAAEDQQYTGYHGTHLECLHAILSTGRLLPSDPGLPGTRAFTDRGGVYLHRPINRHLAENYSSLTRYGTKHIFVKPCVEVLYDIRGSMKAGKQTNQVIQAFESVQIAARHLRIATQQWSGSLELPLQAARAAFETLGLGDRLSVHAMDLGSSGGVAPLRTNKSGDTPSRSSGSTSKESSIPPRATASSSEILAIVEEELPEIQEWLGKEGSLGPFSEASINPDSQLAFAVSEGLASCLRHGHKLRLTVNAAGWTRLPDVLSWPRIAETSATPGDILEVVRSNRKQRCQLGIKADGAHYIRAVQGHSRAEVGEANLLEPVPEEQLPDTLLHGTSWNAYESIQQRGLIPGRSQSSGSKGGSKGGHKWREGRQHVHFFSDAGGVSGQREGSTMLVRISTRKASEQGVRFLISRNGVYLTPDEVPPACITSFQSLRTGDLYDRDGESIPSTGKDGLR